MILEIIMLVLGCISTKCTIFGKARLENPKEVTCNCTGGGGVVTLCCKKVSLATAPFSFTLLVFLYCQLLFALPFLLILWIHLLSLQLYSAVLVLEELEKKALTHVVEDGQAELVAKKETMAQVFARLKLKPANETSTRCVGGCGIVWMGSVFQLLFVTIV